MAKCYITEKECEFYDGEECLAVFEEQCPIANMSDEELATPEMPDGKD